MVNSYSRRRLLVGSSLWIAASVAGCTFMNGQLETATPAGPEGYLPEPGDGWEQEKTGDYDWESLGGQDGVRGFYTGPDGENYEAVVMFSEDFAEGSARSWACAGWQIALATDGVAVAASTGTEQRTFTPEKPPTMTRTPARGREDRVHEFLTRSPRFTAEEIERQQITCNR